MVATTYGTLTRVDWINAVTQYNADPAGVQDSTNQINNALLAAAPGQPVYLPTGTYKTSFPIQMPPGAVLLGDMANEVSTYLDGYWGTVIQPSASWGPTTIGANTFYGAITPIGQTVASPNYATVAVEPRIFGIYVDCHLVPGGTLIDGVQIFGNVSRAHLQRVCVSHCSGHGLNYVNDASANGPDAPHVERFVVRYSTLAGFNHTKISDSTYYDCMAENCATDGWTITNASNGKFIGCRSEHNGTTGSGNGYTWICTSDGAGSGSVIFDGCSSDRNEAYGMFIESTNSSGIAVQVENCCFRRDGRNNNSGGGGLAGIYVNAYPGTVMLNGSAVWPGVDDNSSGVNSPQIGLKLAGNSQLTQIIGAGCYFQGASTAISDDGSAGLVALSASLGATGTTAAGVQVPVGYTVSDAIVQRAIAV